MKVDLTGKELEKIGRALYNSEQRFETHSRECALPTFKKFYQDEAKVCLRLRLRLFIIEKYGEVGNGKSKTTSQH